MQRTRRTEGVGNLRSLWVIRGGTLNEDKTFSKMLDLLIKK